MDARLGSHQLDTHGWLRLLVAAALVLVFILTLEATPAAGTKSKACRVQNTDTGKTYTALQAAVDAASRGDRLTVKGVCHGGTFIGKSLVIEGIETPASHMAVLDGDGKTRVLPIEYSARVKLRSLVIRDGRARAAHFDSWHRRRCADGDLSCGLSGGGINNRGTLTLRHVVVRGNIAGGGGGISNRGTLTLRDSVVRGNTAFGGGGVYSDRGTVTLNGSSISRNNTARGTEGGGVYIGEGTLTLNGSRISGNTSGGYGGGVSNDGGSVTLNGSSSITANTAPSGGGVSNYSAALTLNGSSTISGNEAFSHGDDWDRAGQGGGVFNMGGPGYEHAWGRVFLNDSSSITGNSAERGGGGVAFHGGSEASSVVVCGPAEGANVYGNTPDDCFLR